MSIANARENLEKEQSGKDLILFMLRLNVSGMMICHVSLLKEVQRQSEPSSIRHFIILLFTRIFCRMSTDSIPLWRVMISERK